MRSVSDKLSIKDIFSVALLCFTTGGIILKAATGHETLQGSYLVVRGTEFSLRCPHFFKKLSLEWKLESSQNISQRIGDTERIKFPHVGFNSSGRYTCNETRVTNEGLRFVLHEVNVLVVEHKCTDDNSTETVHCRVKYFGDDKHSVKTYQICKPLGKHAIPVEARKSSDEERSVILELLVDKEDKDCVFLIAYLNSSVRLWPPSGDATACYERVMSQPEAPNEPDDFQGIAFLVLQFIVIIMLVSMICFLLRTHASPKKRNFASYSPRGRRTTYGYDEIYEENLKHTPTYILPI